MLGRPERWQELWNEDLFGAGPLRDLVPADHALGRVHGVLDLADLAWLRAEVAPRYDIEKGRPSIDPEAALRLMLAGCLLGVVSDRDLMREAQVNLAIRWFAGYRLTDGDWEALTQFHLASVHQSANNGIDVAQKLFSPLNEDCRQAA